MLLGRGDTQGVGHVREDVLFLKKLIILFDALSYIHI